MPTGAQRTLHACVLFPETRIPRRGREDAWIGAEGTSLSSTQPAPLDTARRRRRGSLTGAQNTSKPPWLQAQPGTFQFARDREAPPSGHDVTRVSNRRVRLPLFVVTPPCLPLIRVLSPSSRSGGLASNGQCQLEHCEAGHSRDRLSFGGSRGWRREKAAPRKLRSFSRPFCWEL